MAARAHWCHIVPAEGPGRARALCACGWTSDVFHSGVGAVEAGLDHTSAADGFPPRARSATAARCSTPPACIGEQLAGAQVGQRSA
jgi:hypothetical protein